MTKHFYVATTLPYVNAEPHIGFALELVQADIIARYRRLMGDEVFFSTGTDEHGLKMYRKAAEEGKDTQAYVDEYAAKFRALKGSLGLSDDLHFVRTTDMRHKAAAQELWRRCAKAGDIYKKKYKGLYCVGDEAFIKETELVEGKCPNHPTLDIVEIEEENYFFRLSAYREKLLAYLGTGGVITPEWRRLEAINFVKQGLEDFSVSRVKEKMPWGVAVQGDGTQVMYVWFDALTNYISTLGWPEDKDGNFKKYWENGETLQLAGKDQVRFQSIMWQAMLMSAGLKTTDRIFYHGFITSGGQKMSKSVGNVIDPMELVKEYGTDALRYFLARHFHPFEDSDFTMKRFKDAYNANLANGLGNLVARTMMMAKTHLPHPVLVAEKDDEFGNLFSATIPQFNFNVALDQIWEDIAKTDEYIQEKKPFRKVVGTITKVREEAKTDIEETVRRIWKISTRLRPFLPATSERIQEAIILNKMPSSLFPRKD